MTAFIIRRLLWTIPVLLLVIFLTFVLMRQIEGNPFRRTSRAVSPAVQQNLERKFNLDEPWYVQYALYVKGVFTLDLGPSLVTRDRTVNDIVKEHFPKSLELGLLAFVWAIALGIPMGVVAALRQNTAYDYTLMFISNVGYAVPSFLVATLLIYYVSSRPVSCRRTAGRAGSTRSCRPSLSGSFRWRTSPGSCADRCWRRSSRTTCAPPRRRDFGAAGS